MKSYKKKIITIFIVVLVISSTVIITYNDYSNILRSQQEQEAAIFHNLTHEFELLVNKTMTFIYGLRGFVYSQIEDGITSDSFNTYAETTQNYAYHVKNFSIAIDNIQTHVYPLKGNELTIGHDLSKDTRENVRSDINKAMTSHNIIISGPYELRQGGLGMVVRNPIYDGNEYWGLVNVVVDLEAIIALSNISKSDFLDFQMTKDNQVFWGEEFSSNINYEFRIGDEIWSINSALHDTLIKENIGILIRNSIFILMVMSTVGYLILTMMIKNTILSSRVDKLIYQDVLTKLPNRIALEMELDSFIQSEKPFAAAFIDLDNFKDINDSLGHSYGDNLLIQLANRFIEKQMNYSTYRWGGDEFIIISHDNTEDFIKLITSIQETISLPIVLNNEEYNITSSAGISFYPLDGTNSEDIIKLADASMYVVKNSGKNKLQVYNNEIGSNLKYELQIERSLEQALKAKTLMLHYQPQLNIKTQKIESVEALLRWQDNGRFISPSVFIPIAEKSNLIHQIDEYVLDKALAQMAEWKTIDFEPRVSINVSAQHFTKGFRDYFECKLMQYNIQPKKIEIEITESLAIENMEIAIALINEIQSIGASAALDDFGTGYSSLSYLAKLNFKRLKIDRSFISEMTPKSIEFAITRSVLLIASSLNMETIAEGVETIEQYQIIKELGCDYYQGYLLSKAIPADELITFITHYKSS